MGNFLDWKFVEELNVYQIAFLLAGRDPLDVDSYDEWDWSPEVRSDVLVHLISLKNAVETERLETLRPVRIENSSSLHWTSTLIDVQRLRMWLLKKGMVGTFFEVGVAPTGGPSDPADTESRFYSPKLAAAIAAWKAVVSDPVRLRGKSPKQAIAQWLTENAKTYGLLNPDGTVNRQGIEEIAKVANWKPNGGAPKTPTVSAEPSPVSAQTHGRVVPKSTGGFDGSGLDDDIPF